MLFTGWMILKIMFKPSGRTIFARRRQNVYEQSLGFRKNKVMAELIFLLFK